MPSALRPLPRLAALPPRARFFVAALRAGQADLRQGCPWEDGELLALCDAVGLGRAAAGRLGACIAFLMREACSPPRLAPPGCPCATPDELALAGAVVALPDAAPPVPESRRAVAGRLPARRRVQGAVLLALASQDLAADARVGPPGGAGIAERRWG
jgi:hypothetical protein